MAATHLSNEVRTFVVQALACHDSPSTVVEAVKKSFGLTLNRQAVEAYDPTKAAGRKLAQRWRELFEETRKDFLEDTSPIAISHKVVRLRTLQRLADKAEGQGNLGLAAQLNEQAAKEMGGAFTNERRLSGPQGQPLPALSPTVIQLVGVRAAPMGEPEPTVG